MKSLIITITTIFYTQLLVAQISPTPPEPPQTTTTSSSHSSSISIKEGAVAYIKAFALFCKNSTICFEANIYAP